MADRDVIEKDAVNALGNLLATWIPDPDERRLAAHAVAHRFYNDAALRAALDAADARPADSDIWQHDETGRIVELPAGSPSPGKRYYRVRGMGGRVSVVGKGNEARVVFTPDARPTPPAPAPANETCPTWTFASAYKYLQALPRQAWKKGYRVRVLNVLSRIAQAPDTPPKWDDVWFTCLENCGDGSLAEAKRLLSLHDAAPTPAPRETPTDGDVLMPKDVPGAGEFRDAFKKAVPPRGADTASWVNGYCAGWTACDAALLRAATSRAEKAEKERDEAATAAKVKADLLATATAALGDATARAEKAEAELRDAIDAQGGGAK